GFEVLAHDFETKVVEPAELGQVRAREGSVGQVGGFQMVSVRTSIFGGPRRLPRHRPTDRGYTLICEEPHDRLPTYRGNAPVGQDGWEAHDLLVTPVQPREEGAGPELHQHVHLEAGAEASGGAHDTR